MDAVGEDGAGGQRGCHGWSESRNLRTRSAGQRAVAVGARETLHTALINSAGTACGYDRHAAPLGGLRHPLSTSGAVIEGQRPAVPGQRGCTEDGTARFNPHTAGRLDGKNPAASGRDLRTKPLRYYLDFTRVGSSSYVRSRG